MKSQLRHIRLISLICLFFNMSNMANSSVHQTVTWAYKTENLNKFSIIIKSFSALSGDRRFLLSVGISPAVLKSRSLGTLVGCADKYCLARANKTR